MFLTISGALASCAPGGLVVLSPARGGFRYMSNPLNKAIVKRWRAKSQVRRTDMGVYRPVAFCELYVGLSCVGGGVVIERSL